MIDTYTPYDTVRADQLDIGDLIRLDGSYVEITDILETDDSDEVLVVGLDYSTGDTERYPLVWDDEYDLFKVDDDD